ncbi:cytoskeleton protein RodZ [Enterovibrio nigricans]|uniref:Cytoskeleton protein RodZ n=1 Tax=Enterovibrio nigricans DSM 22720 TaxID=1121868 RepID=A0A1T4URI7_9GAMM|nr:cytoskeleton protein RodZ [Enterovibrio nigricans]SKA55256.1 cytoskeleton protein RodZ [Enterovibrio nigricans DSM 22720]
MNTELNEEQLDGVETSHPGTVLKQAREQMGLSAQDVADRLRLRVSVIQELEANCCDGQQIATFTRGYIRSYAKLVGVDADSLLGDFKPSPEIDENAQKMQSFSGRAHREKHDSRVMGLTWIILAVVVSITTFWWWQNQENEDLLTLPDSNNLLVTEAAIEADPVDAVVTTEVIEPQDTTAPSIDTQITTDTGNNVEPVVNEEAPKPELVVTDAETPTEVVIDAPAQPIETPTNSPALVLTFEGDCWVDVRDASGKRLLTGIKSAGESVELTGKAPFKLVLGAPAAVELAYNGEKVDLSGYPSGRVARLSLPK